VVYSFEPADAERRIEAWIPQTMTFDGLQNTYATSLDVYVAAQADNRHLTRAEIERACYASEPREPSSSWFTMLLAGPMG
jgi:hypothetical protein